NFKMKKLVVSAFVKHGKIRLFLDGEKLEKDIYPLEVVLDNDGHILQWFVESWSEGNYTVSISSPGPSEMHFTKRIGKGSKDWGGVWL
uniref:hypothetical protein n=1 Tax=Aquiflexum sp. TaxID=1872584 RepID=UPI003592FAF9